MANALACAAANASLDLFEREPRLAQVAVLSTALAEGLEPCRGMPGVRAVRVLGGIGVVQLDHEVDMAAATRAAAAHGVWLRPFRDLVYTMPPYVTTAEDLSLVAAAVVAGALAG